VKDKTAFKVLVQKPEENYYLEDIEIDGIILSRGFIGDWIY
jgi:hypothetical protein